jgi:hypothetical protein
MWQDSGSAMSSASRLALAALPVLLAWGCASLKDAPVEAHPSEAGAADGPGADDAKRDGAQDDDGAVGPADAGPDVDPATVGPGPLGALPTGFCCATDDQCRNRHCQLVGGTKMCLDFCLKEDDCQGVASGFHCAFTVDGYGFCEPAAGVTTCAAQSLYQHGTKPLGSCCDQRSDGRMGSECLSGVCDRNGATNPYICSDNCGKVLCPPTYTCGHADNFGIRSECLPVANAYACLP